MALSVCYGKLLSKLILSIVIRLKALFYYYKYMQVQSATSIVLTGTSLP